MKVCECSSITRDIELSPQQTVYEAKVIIAKYTHHDVAEIKLIYKGNLLMNNKKLFSYGITDSSIIHIVISKISESTKVASQSSDGNEPTTAEISSMLVEHECDDPLYPNSIVDSILQHVIGNVHIPLEQELSMKQLNDFHYALDSYSNIIKIAVKTPLVQDILADVNITRCLVLTNPLITELMELNPQFNQFIMNDDNVREVAHILSDPQSYDDFPRTKQTILYLVESRIGCRLKFTEEYSQLIKEEGMTVFCCLVPITSIYDVASPPPSGEYSSDSFPSDEQKHESASPCLSSQADFKSRSSPFSRSLDRLGSKSSLSAWHSHRSSSARSLQSSDGSLPNFWRDGTQEQAVLQEERDEHINLVCQIIAHRPDIVYSFMRKTRLYKEMEQKFPGIVNEVLTPSRLRMMSNPDVVHSLIRMDHAIQRLQKKDHSKK